MPRVRREPQRRCVACGESAGKRRLLRVVRAPSGEVSYDATGKAPGRGAYICAQADCLATAAQRGALSRSLKAQVPPEAMEALRQALGV